MNVDPIFSFKDKRDNGSYDIYLFKDFSSINDNDRDNIFPRLDKIRKKIHSPDAVFIICSDDSIFDKKKHRERFTDTPNIQYIKYKDVEEHIFKIGVSQIVDNNKVVQYAPSGTQFSKTSGDKSNYFIKASLSLLEYPQICFLALALHRKITPEKISTIKKFYVDTSSIMPLIQALIHYQNTLLAGTEFHPEIINFKSYNDNSIDFNIDNSYTVISASSSGNLQKKIEVGQDKCITIFLPKSIQKECLFQVNIKYTLDSSQSLMLIPLTSEDFSLEYSKSEEFIIRKKDVEKLDVKKLIKKLLTDEFKNVKYCFPYGETYNSDILKFGDSFLNNILQNFSDNMLNRCLLSKKDNYIIYNGKELSKEENTIKSIDFINNNFQKKALENKNIIVVLNQSNKNELIQISQKLRGIQVFNITYVIGILLTENISQSKNLQDNICFNDTPYKYGFYCYLDLPLLTISKPDLLDQNLSDGFVFYESVKPNGRSSELDRNQVYLVVCVILELLRHDDKLKDNISYHDVISPKNFSRFNDSLLQLSILFAAKGRELNFRSNMNLSHEMLNVVIDLMKENERVGDVFIKFIKDKKIYLATQDYSSIKLKYQQLFEE